MATVDPSKFYQPTQWANGDASLSSTVVPNWFAGVQPVSFEDAMARVQQLQAQEEQIALAQQQEEERRLENERAQRAAEAEKKMGLLWQDGEPPPAKVLETLMQHGLTKEAIAWERNQLAKDKAKRPDVRSAGGRLWRMDESGIPMPITPEQTDKRTTAKPNYQYVKDITGYPVIDPRTGQPLVYDKNSLQEMTSALARASEISGEPTPGPAPSPTPGDRYLGVDRKTGMKAYLKPDGRTVLRNE